jgi:hypothetical protein
MLRLGWCWLLWWLSGSLVHADWPTLRGNPQRAGFIEQSLQGPLAISWVRHFRNERIGPAVEPIVSQGRLFLGTHQGNLWALNVETGEALWRFQAHGAFLHSPAVADGLVLAGNTDGRLYALETATGKLRWFFDAGPGGFAASPTIGDGVVMIGSRRGVFFALDLTDGTKRWHQPLAVPIRQTAAFDSGKVFVTAEDLRLRCFNAADGKLEWITEPMFGQTARDYYPVVVRSGPFHRVVVRTNPLTNMADHVNRDRRFLCQQAKVDDSSWQKLEAWLKSPDAMGTAELIRQEQQAIQRYLDQKPTQKTFYMVDAKTGKAVQTAPILWTGGCQSVGTPPVALPDGRLLVMYRSAYGNWNLGVAPLVALGYLHPDLTITPLRHRHGQQPPWETFWGTADESQHFVIAGDQVFIVHQATLSVFDRKTNSLQRLAGDRDGWGGYRHLPWARNEWNGPGRGGVAVADDRLYWQTGSRIICLAPKVEKPSKDGEIDAARGPNPVSPAPALARRDLHRELVAAVRELLTERWAPLVLEPGIGGREVIFKESGVVFEALTAAFPHLPDELKAQVKRFLAEEWQNHSPWTKSAWYPLERGKRREWHPTPQEFLAERSSVVPDHHPFGNLHAIRQYAVTCNEWERVRAAWPKLRECYHDFSKQHWQLDPKRGDLYANRYIASLMAFAQIAEKMNEPELARETRLKAEKNLQSLVAWWQRTADEFSLRVYRNIVEWDQFLSRGDALFHSIRPHHARIALFGDLTPEIAALVRQKAPKAVDRVMESFQALCGTWYLAHEERQVHVGENLYDSLDFSLHAFRAMAWFKHKPKRLPQYVDVPACRGDLFFILKLAIALETP